MAQTDPDAHETTADFFSFKSGAQWRSPLFDLMKRAEQERIHEASERLKGVPWTLGSIKPRASDPVLPTSGPWPKFAGRLA